MLLAGPRGRLSAPAPLPEPRRDSALAIADINGDRNRDVVQVWTDYSTGDYPNYPAGVTILWGDGQGALSTRTTTPTRCCPSAVAVGEFTGDGTRDLVVVSRVAPSRGWLLEGDGRGGFTARRPNINYRGAAPIKPVVTDLNADRKDDVAVLNGAEEPHDVTIQLGDGGGGFSRPRRVLSHPFGVGAFALGRFNSDRWLDLAAIAVRQFTVDAARPRLHVFMGTARGPFRRGGRFDLGRNLPLSVAPDFTEVVAADFDGDRRQDLAVKLPGRPARTSSSVRVLRGTGRGSFGRARTVAVGREFDYGPLEVGLFNRDRQPDLAVGSGTNVPFRGSRARVSILLNTARW